MKPKDHRKPETIIAELRKRLAGSVSDRAAVAQMYHEADQLARDYKDQHRFASHDAQQLRAELADWKRRFDALLAAIPELRKVSTMDTAGAHATITLSEGPSPSDESESVPA